MGIIYFGSTDCSMQEALDVLDFADLANRGGAAVAAVVVAGTAGSSGATVTLVLAEDATEPSQYYCTSHGNGMGNLITLVAPSASDDPLGQAQYSNTGSSSPITVTGLSNGTSYSVTGTANNDFGASVQSSASSVTPVLITQEIG